MPDLYIEVTNDDFEKKVIESQEPVLVDFWAPWCGPCQTMGQVIATLADRFGGKIKFAKCNLDDHPNLATRFRIKSIPTIMIFNQGRPVEIITGLTSLKKVTESVEKAIGDGAPALKG